MELNKQKKLFLAFLLALIDQGIKALVLANAAVGGIITIVYNDGATFGLFPGTNTILIVISVFAGAAITYFLLKAKRIEAISLAFILGGILGNFLDRIIRGEVIDYISLFGFPVFNFADMCIVGGVSTLILLEVIQGFQKSSNSSNSSK